LLTSKWIEAQTILLLRLPDQMSRRRDSGVAWQAGGVADPVVALEAIGADPVTLHRFVLLDERRRHSQQQSIRQAFQS
jgi:hypothetical protein